MSIRISIYLTACWRPNVLLLGVILSIHSTQEHHLDAQVVEQLASRFETRTTITSKAHSHTFKYAKLHEVKWILMGKAKAGWVGTLTAQGRDMKGITIATKRRRTYRVNKKCFGSAKLKQVLHNEIHNMMMLHNSSTLNIPSCSAPTGSRETFCPKAFWT